MGLAERKRVLLAVEEKKRGKKTRGKRTDATGREEKGRKRKTEATGDKEGRRKGREGS